jgi:hypothetical protein
MGQIPKGFRRRRRKFPARSPKTLRKPVSYAAIRRAAREKLKPLQTETDHSLPAAPPPLRRRRRRGRALGAFLSFAFLAVLAGTGVVLALLAGGRIDLDPLRPAVVAALQGRLGPGLNLEIGGLALERQKYGLALVLKDFAVRNGDGHTILAAPKADVHLSTARLLAAAAEPTRVDIEDLAVRLRIEPDGGVDLSVGGGESPVIVAAPDSRAGPGSPPDAAGSAPEAAAPARRARLLQQAGRAVNAIFDIAAGSDSPIAQLDHFGVQRGQLIVEDLATGQQRGFDNFEFSLDRKRGGTEARQGSAEVKMAADGPNGHWSLSGEARGARDEAHGLTIAASGFTIDELALALGKTTLPVDSDMSLSLKAEASFQADGHVLDAHARLALSAGFWRFDDPEFAPVFLDEMFAGAHWEAQAHRLVADEVQIFSGPTRFFLKGALTAPSAEGRPWGIQFDQIEPGTIGPDRAGEKNVVISGLHGDMTLDLGAKRLDVQRVELRGPEVAAAAQGSVDWVDGPHVRFGVSAAKMPAAGALALWPNALAAPARGWAGDHLLGGSLESLRLAVDLDDVDLRMMRAQHPPMNDRILIDYTIKDAAFSFLDGVPQISGVSGRGHSTGRTTTIMATGGVMETAPGRKIELSDALFSMPDFNTQPIAMNIGARVKGNVDVLGEILARPAFAHYASLPVDAKTIKGQVDGTFVYRMKMTPVFDPSLSAIEVAAKVENFSAERLVGKEKLDQASLTVTATSGGTRITGGGKLFGANATLELMRKGDEPAQGVIAFTLDEAGRAKAGLNLGNGVTGPVAVKIVGAVGAAHPQAQVELDLTRAAFNYPVPGLYKTAGRAAKASFAYREDERGPNLDQLVFDGGGATARGAVQLSADGAVQSAKFSQLKFSPGDSLQLEAVKSGETLKITARGEALDARPFLKNLSANAEAGRTEASDFDLDVQSTVMSGANRQIVANAVLRLSKKGQTYRALNFSGKLGGDPIEVNLSHPDGGAPLLKVASEDAGALLAFLDLYDHMEGGRLKAAFRLANGGLAGPVDIDKFLLRGEPAMRSFASAPAGEQLAARVRLNPDTVSFTHLHAVIDKTDGVLKIRDGAVANPNIGSTIEGWMDFNRDAMDFSGTFVPAYGVNNLFGQLPVVGLILGGGDKEGLIGVNYRVTGRPGAPVLSVNPLSAITPGIFRKIFGALPLEGGGMEPPQ